MTNRKPIPKNVREQVFKKYNGHCAYCGCELTLKTMQIDHIYSVYHSELNAKGEITSVDDIKKGKYDRDYLEEKASHVNDIDNLMPACRQCNFYKGAMDIETFRNSLETTLYKNTIKPFQFRLAEKYGLVKATPHPIKFYFERIEE